MLAGRCTQASNTTATANGTANNLAHRRVQKWEGNRCCKPADLPPSGRGVRPTTGTPQENAAHQLQYFCTPLADRPWQRFCLCVCLSVCLLGAMHPCYGWVVAPLATSLPNCLPCWRSFPALPRSGLSLLWPCLPAIRHKDHTDHPDQPDHTIRRLKKLRLVRI